MTVFTPTGLAARPGPPSQTPEWYAARTKGVTATEVRDLAKGYKSNRRRIMREKLTGDRINLAGNPAVEYGHLREPLIGAWITKRFGIPASDLLYIQIADESRLATPDGVEVDEFGNVYVSETKTSKYDLTPGKIVDGVLVLTKGPGGKWYLQDNHFADTGYYDQMQWQMFVMGSDRTLFAWEQHDGDWSEWPRRAPRTLTDEPGWCWVLRDEKRIAELIVIADAFIAELAEARAEIEAGNTAVIPELTPEEEMAIAEAKAVDDARKERLRNLARLVIAERELEAKHADAKAKAWQELQELLAEEADDYIDEDAPDVRVSWISSRPIRRVFNRDRAIAKAPTLVKRYEELVVRYTETVVGDPKSTLTVTKPKTK